MGEVIEMNVSTTQPIAPEKVLQNAPELESVLVLGWAKSGEFYIAASDSDMGDLLLLIELAKRETLAQLDA